MLSSTEMAAIIVEKFDDGEFHSTGEAKAAIAARLSEADRKLQETNHRTGKLTGKLKWEHEFHSALARLKKKGQLVRGEWGTFKIVSRPNGHLSTTPAVVARLPSDDPVALLAEVSAVVKRVGGTERLKQILEMMSAR
jgi:hypothetical protein